MSSHISYRAASSSAVKSAENVSPIFPTASFDRAPAKPAGGRDRGKSAGTGGVTFGRPVMVWTRLLYGRTVSHMEAPSKAEMHEVLSASVGGQPGDVAVRWQSTFGLIVIEVRGGQVYVNGDLVVHWMEAMRAVAGCPRQTRSSDICSPKRVSGTLSHQQATRVKAGNCGAGKCRKTDKRQSCSPSCGRQKVTGIELGQS